MTRTLLRGLALPFLCIAWGVVLLLLVAPTLLHAQGLVKGVQDGAKAGSKAAGPVGGVLGGAIGGVVGAVTGVLGVPAGNNDTWNSNGVREPDASSKAAKASKSRRGTKVSRTVVQPNEPVQLTADQVVANSDANIARIKEELKLTPEQEKNWASFNSAMHYLGHNGISVTTARIG